MDVKPRSNLFDQLHTLLPPALQYLDVNHLVIWIDPLDGTREFVHGDYRAVTILVGISYFDHAIAGVILAPYEDGPIICGGYGVGIFTNVPIVAPTRNDSFLRVLLPLLHHLAHGTGINAPAAVQQGATDSIDFITQTLQPDNFATYFALYSEACDAIQKQLFTICKRFHTYIPTQSHGKVVYITSSSRNHDAFKVFLQQCKYDSIIFAGGAGYKAILLLVGSANVYTFPLPGTKKWDTCAIQAILETHGACFTDALGNPIRYSLHDTFNNSYGLLITMDPSDTIVRPVIDIEFFKQLHSPSL
uniref:3'(2'),5'-bisphosphate nucleotidase 1 n=1 Tax=Lygus hesperus TaxID=30085 RepID=A0A0A9WYW3_LYGHE